MSHLKMILNPAVLNAVMGKLLQSLAWSLLLLSPGLLLSLAGYRILGAMLLLVASFAMMARSYRRPWRWNPWLAWLPPAIAMLSLGLQWRVFGAAAPGLPWALVSLVAGLGLGWFRGRSHQFFQRDGYLMTQRTLAFLLVWFVSSAFIQLMGLLAWQTYLVPGLAAGLFSTCMLLAMTATLARKARQGTPPGSAAPARLATAVLVALLIPASGWSQQPGPGGQVDRMRAVSSQAIEHAAQFTEGLVDQQSQAYTLSAEQSQVVEHRAMFEVPLSEYSTESDTEVLLIRYADSQSARKSYQARERSIQPLVAEDDRARLGPAGRGALRGEASFHSVYQPRTGGIAHRALIQQGLWLIDVDARAWKPADKDLDTLLQAQARLSTELASHLFDAGVAEGLIDLDALEPPSLDSTAASPATRSAPTNQPPTTPDPDFVDLERVIDDMMEQESGIDPQDAATVTALITLILVVGGLSLDAAQALATAITEGLLESSRENAEVQQLVEEVEQELYRPARDEGETSQVEFAADVARGIGRDVVELGREIVEGTPIVVEALAETAQDLAAFHPATLNPERIQGVFGDLENARQTLGEVVAGLGQLAGEQVAQNLDQDTNVQVALEALGLATQLSLAPGVAELLQTRAQLQQLLADQPEAVLAGLQRLGQIGGRGVYEAARMSVGAQEWENAVNGDLSPLTRVANALLAAGQTAGVVHSTGATAARWLGATEDLSQAARLAELGQDATRTLEPAADAARGAELSQAAGRAERQAEAIMDPARQLPERGPAFGNVDFDGTKAPLQQIQGWQSRRNPATGAIEWRRHTDQPFGPLPDEVAAAMRNQPLEPGQTRLNPDTGDIQWRNPETGVVERAPQTQPIVDPDTGQLVHRDPILNRDYPEPMEMQRRPGYEQSPVVAGTGPDAQLRGLKPGQVIPEEVLPQTGYAPHQIDELGRVAREENVIFAGRTTNMDSLEHVAKGTGTPKPVYIKSKTITDLDVRLGAHPDDKGLVGYFRPRQPDLAGLSQEEVRSVMQRYTDRMKEYEDLRKDVDLLIQQGGVVEEGGKLHRVFGDGRKVPFAGDIDPVSIRNAHTGEALTGDRYQQVLQRFQQSGAEIQHGAELNMSRDLQRMSQLEPGTKEFEKLQRKIETLHAKLQAGHSSGKEVVVEMWPDGKLRRGRPLSQLGMEV